MRGETSLTFSSGEAEDEIYMTLFSVSDILQIFWTVTVKRTENAYIGRHQVKTIFFREAWQPDVCDFIKILTGLPW